jgi:hypothetical protein
MVDFEYIIHRSAVRLDHDNGLKQSRNMDVLYLALLGTLHRKLLIRITFYFIITHSMLGYNR